MAVGDALESQGKRYPSKIAPIPRPRTRSATTADRRWRSTPELSGRLEGWPVPPFEMEIQQVLKVADWSSPVVTGRIRQGVLEPREPTELVDGAEVVAVPQTFLDPNQPPGVLGVVLYGLVAAQVRPGQVLRHRQR